MKRAKTSAFDDQTFLDTTGAARKIREFKKNETIFAQGDPAKTVMYIQKGSVKLSVVNGEGKEAVVAMLGPNGVFRRKAGIQGCSHRCRSGRANAMAQHLCIQTHCALFILRGIVHR
jgi:CRP-like cAMP-binding protein